MRKIIHSFVFVSLMSASVGITLAAPIEKEVVYQQRQQVISVEGANNTRTIRAKGGEKIVIEGVNNKVTIVGNVSEVVVEGGSNSVNGANIAKITIEGTENVVNAANVDVVVIEGGSNHVHYKSSSNKSGNASVKTEGVDNMIKKIR